MLQDLSRRSIKTGFLADSLNSASGSLHSADPNHWFSVTNSIFLFLQLYYLYFIESLSTSFLPPFSFSTSIFPPFTSDPSDQALHVINKISGQQGRIQEFGQGGA